MPYISSQLSGVSESPSQPSNSRTSKSHSKSPTPHDIREKSKLKTYSFVVKGSNPSKTEIPSKDITPQNKDVSQQGPSFSIGPDSLSRQTFAQVRSGNIQPVSLANKESSSSRSKYKD